MSTIDERGKQVITELDLRAAAAGDTLRIDEDSMLTPLAQDLARERGIQIERVRRRSAARKLKIAQPELSCNDRTKNRDCQTVNEIDQGSKKNESGDPPTQSNDSYSSCAGSSRNFSRNAGL